MDPQFTVSARTENDSSYLLRLAACLGRHRIKIESFTCTNSEASNVYQHSIAVRAAPDRIRRAVKQIGALVGVLEVSYHRDVETHNREVALFKAFARCSVRWELALKDCEDVSRTDPCRGFGLRRS